jgi:hypothetical protein
MKRALLAACAVAAMLAPATAQERLPDGIVSDRQERYAQAWLTRPTKRYDHAILGDAIEAGGLAVKMRDGKTLELVLPQEFVFEDRMARIHDLDGDGRDEVIVVLASVTEGGALAIYGVRGGKLVKLAQTRTSAGATGGSIRPSLLTLMATAGSRSPPCGSRIFPASFRPGAMRAASSPMSPPSQAIPTMRSVHRFRTCPKW